MDVFAERDATTLEVCDVCHEPYRWPRADGAPTFQMASLFDEGEKACSLSCYSAWAASK